MRLSRALHRPPAWLREDDTGDGWALVSFLASIAGSKVAGLGFERAATAAKLTRDVDAIAFFTLIGRLQDIGKDLDDEVDEEQGSGVLDGFDDDVVSRLGGFVEFYRAAIRGDLAKMKSRAEVAIASLGLTDPTGLLKTPEPVPKVTVLDPALRGFLDLSYDEAGATMGDGWPSSTSRSSFACSIRG